MGLVAVITPVFGSMLHELRGLPLLMRYVNRSLSSSVAWWGCGCLIVMRLWWFFASGGVIFVWSWWCYDRVVVVVRVRGFFDG